MQFVGHIRQREGIEVLRIIPKHLSAQEQYEGGGGVPKIRVPYFGGPYYKNPTILYI